MSEHPGHEGDEDFVHPWAREMYRRGFSFNGGERTKVFLAVKEGLQDVSDVSRADSPLDGRALIAADFDDDGDVDLFVHNIQRERHHLFRNELNPGDRGFLSLRLVGDGREPIGATVRVTPEGGSTVAQVVSRGAGYASCQPGELSFGLGDSGSAQVEVRWPGGVLESFGALSAGGRFVLTEGKGKASARTQLPSTGLADPLPPGVKVTLGSELPRMALQKADGTRFELDPKVLTENGPAEIVLWASYCAPCVEKLPALRKRAGSGEEILALSVDVPADRDRAEALVAARAPGLPSFYMDLDEGVNDGGLDLVIDLMRLPIPTTLVLGEGGRLVEVVGGRGEVNDR